MNSRQFRRRCAAIGAAAAIITTTAFAPIASSAAAAGKDGPKDRPCFIVQSHWNTAYDGPQPTCPRSIRR